MNPFLIQKPHSTVVLCDIKGSGTIKHIWLTLTGTARRAQVIRIYWDGIKGRWHYVGDLYALDINME